MNSVREDESSKLQNLANLNTESNLEFGNVNPKRVKLLTKILMDNKYGLLDDLNYSRPLISSADGIQAVGSGRDVPGYENAMNPMAQQITEQDVADSSGVNIQHLINQQKQLPITGTTKAISRTTKLKADRVRIYLDYYYGILERSIQVDRKDHKHEGVEGVYNPLQIIRNRKLKKKNNDMPVRELGISKTPFIAIKQFSSKPNKKMPWFVDITEKHTDMTWRTSHWDELIGPDGKPWSGKTKHHYSEKIRHRPHIHHHKKQSEKEEHEETENQKQSQQNGPPQINIVGDSTSKGSNDIASYNSSTTDLGSSTSKFQAHSGTNEGTADISTVESEGLAPPTKINSSNSPNESLLSDRRKSSPDSTKNNSNSGKSDDNLHSHLEINATPNTRRTSINSISDQYSNQSVNSSKYGDKNHLHRLEKVIGKKPKKWSKSANKLSKKVNDVTATTMNIANIPEEIGAPINIVTNGLTDAVNKAITVNSGTNINGTLTGQNSLSNISHAKDLKEALKEGKNSKEGKSGSHGTETTKSVINSESSSNSSSGIIMGNVQYMSPAEALTNQKKSILLSDIPVEHLKTDNQFDTIAENSKDGGDDESSNELSIRANIKNTNVDWQLQRYWQDMKYISSTMTLMKHRRMTHDLVKKKEIHRRNMVKVDHDADATIASTTEVLNNYQNELVKVLKIGNDWTSKLLNDYSIRVDSLISSSDRILSDINTTLTLKLKLFQENSERYGNSKVVHAPKMTKLVYRLLEYTIVGFLWSVWLVVFIVKNIKLAVIVVLKIAKNVLW